MKLVKNQSKSYIFLFALINLLLLFYGAQANGSDLINPVKVATGAYPDIAVDSAGNVHLVYARAGRLRYKKYDISTKTWSPEQNTGIPQLASYRNDPDIAVDSLNRPHVVGGKGSGTGKYAYWNGSAWVQIDAYLNRDTELVIDNNDNVYILDRSGNNGGYLGLVRRDAGASNFTILPDPDIANGLPLGQNDHTYGHIFVNPLDNSIHVVYRHGAPQNCSYRASLDGGQNWFGGGISADDIESPSGTASINGSIYVVTGNGTVRRLTGVPSSWKSLGRAVTAGRRHSPNISTDQNGNLYVGSFGGKYNIRLGGAWIGEKIVPSLSGAPVGFMVVAGDYDFAYAVWEEGTNVNAENDNNSDNFDIVFATILPDSTVGW